ncbi:MAG TPA: hypothetical protein VJ438_02370 [Candidatus Nanoarchaeia archaeon]|nr:hypothetical protein [Candidatus Nanoarchaeia archaeon]
MKNKISKTDTNKIVEDFFGDINDKTSEEIKKIKRLVMGHNIPLKEKKKLFCKKCLKPYKNPKIRIRNKIKSITCDNCGSVNRWKLK